MKETIVPANIKSTTKILYYMSTTNVFKKNPFRPQVYKSLQSVQLDLVAHMSLNILSNVDTNLYYESIDVQEFEPSMFCLCVKTARWTRCAKNCPQWCKLRPPSYPIV